MYIVMKILLGLSALGFVAGILQGELLAGILCALIFLVPAGILFIISYHQEKKAEEKRKSEVNTKLQEKQDRIAKVLPMVKSVYDTVYASMGCRSQVEHIDILWFNSIAELNEHQRNGDYWKSCVRNCHIWISNCGDANGERTLYLLETYERVVNAVTTLPHAFETEHDVDSMIWRRVIPFSSIIGLESLGNVSQTTKITGGENITYRGISINGIGFGQFEIDPIKIEQEFRDTRFVALKYTDGSEQLLMFPREEIPKLLKILIEESDEKSI